MTVKKDFLQNEELKMVKSEKAILEEKLQNDVDELRKLKRSLEKKLDKLQAEFSDKEVRMFVLRLTNIYLSLPYKYAHIFSVSFVNLSP